jgi:hypothetical protein
LVQAGQRENFQISGDSVYRPDCQARNEGSSAVSLSGDYYTQFDGTFDCDKGSTISVKFDLSISGKANGHVTTRYSNGNVVEFDLNCGK